MRTVSLLNENQGNIWMTLPLTEDVISSLSKAITNGMFKIAKVGLDFNYFSIMFRPSELACFSETKLLRSDFKGRVLLDVEGNQYEEEKVLSFIMAESMKKKEHMIEKILQLSSDNVSDCKETTASYRDRSQELRELLKEFYGHQCMICKCFILTEGAPYTEGHHMIPLSQGGYDSARNIAIMCPNCHAKAHHGRAEEKKSIWAAFRKTNPFLEAG